MLCLLVFRVAWNQVRWQQYELLCCCTKTYKNVMLVVWCDFASGRGALLAVDGCVIFAQTRDTSLKSRIYLNKRKDGFLLAAICYLLHWR